MTQIIEFIQEPQTILSFLVFVFGLGVTRASLNSRVKMLEKKTEELEKKLDELQQIKEILSRMQADIDWIKSSIKK